MTTRPTIAVLVLLAVASVTWALPYLVVDTGQDSCYDTLHAIAPPLPGAPFYGQDAQFAGNQPSYHDNGDGTVSDLVTGLMWVQARGRMVEIDSAIAGAADCRVGGYADWRMPSIKELYSLIDFRGFIDMQSPADCRPYIDTTCFEFVYGDTAVARAIDCQDWSGTRNTGDTMTFFGVNFADGRIKSYPRMEDSIRPPSPKHLYVRYVRGAPDYGRNRFGRVGDSTVTDSATGLMWMELDSRAALNWRDALAWVQARNEENYCGYNDWRLPNAKELQSIVDYTRSPGAPGPAQRGPAIDTSVFAISTITNERGEPDYPWFWTGTTHLDGPLDRRCAQAVYVSFGRAGGWMMQPGNTYYSFRDFHGAGAQRSDPKQGSVTDYFLGHDSLGNPVYGRGPQGDCLRIANHVRLVRGTGSGVEEGEGSLPGSQERLCVTAASPSRGRAVVRYDLPAAGPVRLVVRDLAGREVKTLVEGLLPAGSHEAAWDGTDSRGRLAAPGVYFIQARAGDLSATQKLVLPE